MALITVQDLTFGYDGSYDNIFEHADFQIDTSWRLGFVGRNGRGKTTFLKLLMGKYEYRGSISAPVKFDYFPFSVRDEDELTATVLEKISPDCPQWRLLREMALLEIDADVLYRSFSTLSNGERTKMLLCALFSREKHFLLIDEPTNHLDLHGREVLRRYLRTKQGFILVSHDRAFLDGCIDHVLSINKATIEVQRGNYSTWLENKRRQDNFELASNEKLKKEISRLEQSSREKASWANRSEREITGFDPKKTEKSAGRRPYLAAQSKKAMKRSKAIEARQQAAIEEKSALLKNIETAEALKLPAIPYRAERLVELREFAVCYDEREIFPPVSFEIGRGDRIALCGGNGSGKTSLLRALCGEKVPYHGTLRLAGDLKISYLPQETGHLRGSLRAFIEDNGLDATLFLAILRKLDFSRGQFEKPMEAYSAGQKKKVLLTKSLCEPASLYVWDEPLNYIDILSRGQIEDLLLSCKPTILFVEHDRVFCDTVATKKIELK